MNTGLPLLVIGLILGGGVGFTIAAANGITLDGHDHVQHGALAAKGHVNAGHNATLHGDILALPPSATSPTLSVVVHEDPAAGWNLHIATENFAFSPQNASRDHIDGEGHAHIYINGTKLGRVYAPWVHLDHLPKGKVTVDVTLNANDHRELAVGDTVLRQTITIQN